MRLPTFSFLSLLRHTRLVSAKVISSCRNNNTLTSPHKTSRECAGDCLEISPSWPEEEATELRQAVLRDMLVTRDFVSTEEEQSLAAELEPYLRKMRYEYDHWDDAIHGFRETERSVWSPENQLVLNRVVSAAFPAGADALQHTHVLDLAAGGHIKPHVDAVRFCGRVIAGICLLSDAVMRLIHTEHKNRIVDVLLPRRGLYIMKDTARYDFTHEVLAQDSSVFRGRKVERTRRVSVICRSTPEPVRQDD